MTLSRTRILVVDDVADVADSTVELLALWGYDPVACYTGAAALTAAALHRPAAIVLDLLMPRMDGFRFAGLVRELPGCGAVPLIAVTGYSSPACRTRARAAGINHYLLKPAKLDELRVILADATGDEAARSPPPAEAVARPDVLKFRKPWWLPYARPAGRPISAPAANGVRV